MQLIGVSRRTRLLGWWMIVVAIAAPVSYAFDVVVGGSDLDSASVVIVGIFALVMSWLGFRTATMGVSTDDSVVTIRNQMRTHRVPKADITSVEIRQRFAIWALGREVLGFVVFGAEDVVIEASRALRSPHGRLFTQSTKTTRHQLSLIAEHVGVAVNDLTR